jgi:hypothetical protein
MISGYGYEFMDAKLVRWREAAGGAPYSGVATGKA